QTVAQVLKSRKRRVVDHGRVRVWETARRRSGGKERSKLCACQQGREACAQGSLSAMAFLAACGNALGSDLALSLPAGDEGKPLEQVHVLFVLEQCAVQRRDQLARVTLAQRLGADVLVEEQLDPVEQFGGRRLLLDAGHLAHVIEDLQGFRDQASL